MLLKGRDPNDKIILKNDFHGTKCLIYPYPGLVITKRQVTHAWGKLCGHYDCDCVKPLGIRGVQDVEIQVLEDGSAKVVLRK